MSRLVDFLFLLFLLGMIVLIVTRLPYVFGPDACWTSC